MSRRSMTRDIHESIRLVLGKNVKILLKSPVKLELKGGDKTENRILVFTAHRLFIMTAKVPAKIDHHFHYLDFRHMESKRPNRISFTFSSGHGHGDKTVTYSFRPNVEAQLGTDASVDEIILVLVSHLQRLFPGVPVQHVIGPIDIQPKDRAILKNPVWNVTTPVVVGPCGGFSSQYSCMCDYYSLPFREEVAWDVDTIYFSHDSHEMSLQDFEHLDHRDLLCIISALEHNTWFTKLKASGSSAKLTSDICERIFQVVNKSTSLEELHVSNIGARWDFLAKMSQAMAGNAKSSLCSFDISCNFLEDKGLNYLSPVIGKHSRGLRHINLSYCSLTGKGISGFANALCANKLNTSTLTYLNLAGNAIKDESQTLCTFLAQSNAVAILDISSTETPLDVMFGALVRGCTTSLTHLNLSRNPFSSKKAKDIPAAFKQYFANTLVLQYLNLSHCKLPSEAVKHLLLGLACNESTANVELNLSSNSLGANGAAVLESCIGGVNCLARLDLSENSIEAEMAGVMQGIMKNRSLLSLNVSRNMTGVKPKHMPNVMESIVQMLQEEETSLQKLNLSDCKLKSEINNVINALGSNQCLQHLDITGNLMGDVGARLLAKALQINTRLKIINLDRNNITLQGYTDITYALQSNYAMRLIPFPTFDLQPFIKTHPDRVDSIIHRMQELLQRNASPHRFRNTAQAFRLTQGFLLSSTQQILDRVSAQTQDNVDALLKLNPEHSTNNHVILAQGMIKDAENSKHLLSALHEVTANGTEVDLKLKQASLELSNFMSSHVHQNVEAMLNCAEKECPRVLKQNEGKCKSDLRTSCQKKCQISPDFISGLIMDQLGLEIHNKINELNLIIANHISDRVIDEVIEGLGVQSKSIVSEAGSLRKKRSLTPDVLKGRSSSLSESIEHETISQASGDATSQKSESSPIGTPQTNKRKSLQGRKLRPKSTAEGGSNSHQHREEMDEISESSTLSMDQSEANKSYKNGLGEEDIVPELPSSSALQHLGKARPRRTKKHAPSRGAIVSHSPGMNDSSLDEEDINRFYSSSANNSFSPGSTPSGSPMLEDVPPRSGSVGSRYDDRKGGILDKKDDKKSNLISGSKRHEEGLFSTKSPLAEKKSPGARLGAGLSCLTSSAIDEDSKKSESPEKRALSPSLHSLSDIFGKKEVSKLASPKPEHKLQSPSGISPFAARKADAEPPTAAKRKSIGTGDEDLDNSKALSPDGDGKKTPESVIKRHGLGHGGNPDLMAEMREKRASMVPKALPEEFSASSKSTTDDEKSTNVFSQIKLRSTGLAGSLASPTSEFAAKSEDGDDTNKGSIVGLRTSKFSSSLMSSSTASATNNSSTSSTNTSEAIAKPKPMPKPRPWSIVGVDRKSGEVTSLNKPEGTKTSKEASPKPPAASSSSSVAPSKKSSVRDLINNMNKAGNSNGASVESTPTEGFLRKKGSSLPRGITPPTDDSSSNLSRSPNLSHSPKITKRSDSTTDDPRILKLDDDFAYDDVLDV